jgi:arylformamidase
LLVLLSHHLSSSTPSFAGGKSLTITPIKEIATGGSSNNYSFSMPCHLGTHIDAPRHFSDEGRPIASFSIEDLVFTRPALVDIPREAGQLIERSDLEPFEDQIRGCDILLLRTGFERFRDSDPTKFSTEDPGLSGSSARYLAGFAGLRALGLDSISLSSVPHREEGRTAHRTLLAGREFFIIEDMHLADYPSKSVARIVVAPLFMEGVDSAPCTVIAEC